MEYPVIHGIDGVYFRVQRNDKWENICFSDLTEEEQDEMMKDRSEEWLKSLCKILGNSIHKVAEQFEIFRQG
jgi:hypothetical protein